VITMRKRIACFNHSGRMILFSLILTCAFFSGSYTAAVQPVVVRGDKVIVETATLSAELDMGLLVSIVRKSDGRKLISCSGDDQSALQLIYSGGETVPLGGEIGDKVTCIQLNDNLAHVRIESWYGDAVIAVSTDRATGDLIVEPSGYSSRPGQRACRWLLTGFGSSLELVVPVFQGLHIPLDDPLVAGTHWRWPVGWEAGLAMLQSQSGGVWVHCRDTEYRFKALQIGIPDNPLCLGLETDAYGPLDNNLSSGGLAWRINVYDGDWREPAARYRDWMSEAYNMRDRQWPEWVEKIKLALSWVPTDPGMLDALAGRVPPGNVLLHVPFWRTDEYDENYPTYNASPEGRAFILKALKMGFHAMPHFNSIDMDPSNPAYDYIRDFQYRELETKKVAGWSWLNQASRPVPESNAARMRHREHKTMVKVHPGLAMWRSILADNMLPAIRELSLETVFLDVSMHARNLHNALVDNMTTAEGMLRLTRLIGSLENGVVVAGEGRNEINMQHQAFAQVHLYKSSGSSIKGLERLKPCPLSEFLFGSWCRSFGYSGLGGSTADERLRMQMHIDLGSIPTLTVGSAAEFKNPNPAVKQILMLAQ
jgi:Domain of unknown function (DUF6259)